MKTEVPENEVIDPSGKPNPDANQKDVQKAQENQPRDAGSAFAAQHRTGTKTRVITKDERK